MDVGSILWMAGMILAVTIYLQIINKRTPASIQKDHSVVSKHCKSCNKIIIEDAENIQFCSTCGEKYE